MGLVGGGSGTRTDDFDTGTVGGRSGTDGIGDTYTSVGATVPGVGDGSTVASGGTGRSMAAGVWGDWSRQCNIVADPQGPTTNYIYT